MLELEPQSLPADFSKLHVLCWAGLSRSRPQKAAAVDISKLVESKDSQAVEQERSTSSTTTTTRADTAPVPPALLARPSDVPPYQPPARNRPLPPPPQPIAPASLRSPPYLPPVPSHQPGHPVLQAPTYPPVQPYAPPVPQYYAASNPAGQPLPHSAHNLPSIAATLGPGQQALHGPPVAGPSQPSYHASRPSSVPLKRSAGEQAGPPEKRHQGKWTTEEENIAIELRRQGMKWEDISKHIPGRSALSCRLHYQNYCEKRAEWNDEKKNKMARLYTRHKREMFEMIASELNMPWRAVEAMHWTMGVDEINERANERAFQTYPSSSKPRSPPPSTPGSSGGEASGATLQPMGVTRSRRSSSTTSIRRRAHSDLVPRNERAMQTGSLPAVSEASAPASESDRPAPGAELTAPARAQVFLTPSPAPSHGVQSTEGSSAGNPETPQRERPLQLNTTDASPQQQQPQVEQEKSEERLAP